jgi:hypothetical protein
LNEAEFPVWCCSQESSAGGPFTHLNIRSGEVLSRGHLTACLEIVMTFWLIVGLCALGAIVVFCIPFLPAKSDNNNTVDIES